MGGRLEREIRLLPQVIAVSVTGGEVVVLVEPGADVAAVARAAAGFAGTSRRIRVVGGAKEPRPAPALLQHPRRLAIVAGGVAAASMLTVASLTGGVSTHAPAVAPPPVESGVADLPARRLGREADAPVAAAPAVAGTGRTNRPLLRLALPRLRPQPPLPTTVAPPTVVLPPVVPPPPKPIVPPHPDPGVPLPDPLPPSTTPTTPEQQDGGTRSDAQEVASHGSQGNHNGNGPPPGLPPAWSQSSLVRTSHPSRNR